MSSDTMVAAPQLDLYGSRPAEAQSKLLAEIRRCWKSGVEYERHMRREQAEWLKFYNGEHWREEAKKEREDAHRPCMTINTFTQYEKQITNSMRQNAPAIKVLPVDSGADVQTAKIQRGIIRHIEQRSHADAVRQVAFDSAVRIGAGYYRIVLDYDDWDSFDREPRCAAIRNQFACYLDPACTNPTGRGARWGLVFQQEDKEAFRQQWGLTDMALNAWQSEGDSWVFEDQVRICEYYWHDPSRVTLVQLQDRSIMVLEDKLLPHLYAWQSYGIPTESLQQFLKDLVTPENGQDLLAWMRQQSGQVLQRFDGFPPELVGELAIAVRDRVATVVQARPTLKPMVRWVKTNGHKILEESIWPGRHIPLLRVIGDEVDIDNHVYRSGIVKNAMDPMRLTDYAVTMMCEHIANSPLAPYMTTKEQINGYEQMWEAANREPLSYLLYNAARDAGGNPLPPPQRNVQEPPIQSIVQMIVTLEQFTQNAIGIYQRNVGGSSEKRSGRAIQAEDEQADTGSFHFAWNLGQTMKLEGDIYLDLISKPQIFPPDKIQRIIGEDGSAQMIQLGPKQTDPQTGQEPPLPEGIAGIYDPTNGRYDSVVTIGPSYATQREEAVDKMWEASRAFPEQLGMTLWKLVDMQDWDGKEDLVDLLKQVPGQILDDPGNDQRALLVQLKQKLQQTTQQLQAIDAFGQQMQQVAEQQAQKIQQLEADKNLEALKVQNAQQDTMADNALEAQKFRHQVWLDQQKVDIEYKKLGLAERQAANEREQAQVQAESQSQEGSGKSES